MQTSRYSQLAIDRTLLRILLGMIGFLILSNVLLIPFASNLQSIDGYFGYVIRQIDLNREKNNFFNSIEATSILTHRGGDHFHKID